MRYLYLVISLLYCIFVSGQNNTNLGTNAGNSGGTNTSIGVDAGDVVTGSQNTFLGAGSGVTLTTGSGNTFLGYGTGYFTTIATGNLFAGWQAGYYNVNGANNVFLGSSAGNTFKSGDFNVAVGNNSGRSVKTGSMNIFLGYLSGPDFTSETSPLTNNIMIGSYAGYKSRGTTGSVYLGYQAGYNEQTSNKLYIDNSSALIPLIYGDFTSNQLGFNIKPIAAHTLTVGGTIHATGIYVNGQSITDAGFEFWTKVGTNIWNNTGNVGIGTTLAQNPWGYRLAVKGKIGAHEVQIENNSMAWSDFVFNDDYKLMSLGDLEKYINENNHLPEIPTEQEVRENGLLVSEMNAKLLQKVEELTLYVIQLKKEIEELKKQRQ